jgi:enoyl-CoA hydratase/carnithine racemase
MESSLGSLRKVVRTFYDASWRALQARIQQGKGMTLIHLRQDGPVARLFIDNPGRKNAISRSMWRAVPQLVAQAAARAGTRALTLQSAVPGCFAAGADISEFESTFSTRDESLKANAEIRAAVDAMAACPFPTIALIDGPCVGGGVALALACDIRIASDRATFGITPARLGLSYHPDDVTRVLRACGKGNASELLFGGQIWNARRGVSAGLANALYPGADFDGACTALVDAISANSLDANVALKRALAAAESRDPQSLQQAEAEFAAMFSQADFHEGRDAFLQKRKAAFPSHRRGKD